MKFDVIVTAGCSFTVGANINNADKKWVGKPYTFTELLGKRLNLPTVNLGKPGGSNDRIVRKINDWILSNQQYQYPLFLIGLSGITRFEYWSHTENSYYDIHLFDWADDYGDLEEYQKQLKTRLPRMLYPEADVSILKNWIKASQFMFNIGARRKQLASWIYMLNSHIKVNSGTAIFFNSLFDDLVGVKDKVNFLSFPIEDKKLKVIDNDYRARHTTLTDSWYHYLRQLHNAKYGDFESGSRSSVPPYGDYFCGGHPSPGGNIVIADLLEEKIKSL